MTSKLFDELDELLTSGDSSEDNIDKIKNLVRWIRATRDVRKCRHYWVDKDSAQAIEELMYDSMMVEN